MPTDNVKEQWWKVPSNFHHRTGQDRLSYFTFSFYYYVTLLQNMSEENASTLNPLHLFPGGTVVNSHSAD